MTLVSKTHLGPKLFYISAILLACSSLATAAPAGDKVDLSQLPQIPPGINDTIYSGYLNVTETRKYHYVFVESRRNPQTDAVILWLNGGPLCSSMIGFIYENGPFAMDDGGHTFFKNNYSWNEVANVIYLESPAGVGYSYAGTPQDQYWDDKNTTADSLAAMVIWYSLFPEYKSNPLYIAGESYAGVYVPYLAVYIHNYNMNATTLPENKINFKGIAVGNACTNYNFDCDPSDWDVYFRFNLYSPEIRAAYSKECPPNDYFDPVSPACSAIYAEILSLLSYVNKYDLMRKCTYNTSNSGQDHHSEKVEVKKSSGHQYARFMRELVRERYPAFAPAYDGPDCTDMSGGEAWMNLNATREALHIMPEIGSFVSCSSTESYHVDFANASYWAYPILINNGYKIMVYSGDTDGIVPTLGSIRWIQQLRKDMHLSVLSPWRQWYYTPADGAPTSPSQVAGYIEVSQGISLVTVKGVGHLVPQWARDRALTLINNFVYDLPFNTTNPNPSMQ